MRVRRVQLNHKNDITFELLDEHDQPIPAVSGFMRHLRARGKSPNTLSAYAYDLLHFMRFLTQHQLIYETFAPTHAWSFLEYLREVPSRTQVQRLGLVLCTTDQERPAIRLSSSTINRILAAVSSFYEYLILSGLLIDKENPIQRGDDPTTARVAERHRPFMGRASRQRPIRRTVRVKTVQRIPRPMDDDHVSKLLASLRLKRDRAMILLMLHGGLRPGEVLNLHLDDISYARKRVVVRYRDDHPKGARTKSRTERVVDLLQSETLQAVT